MKTHGTRETSPRIKGIGEIHTEANILPELEKSGFDIIVGFPLIRKYNLTRVFEEMFTNETEEAI